MKKKSNSSFSESFINKTPVSSKEFFSEPFINSVAKFFVEFGEIIGTLALEIIEARKKIPQANYDLSMYGWYISSDFRPGAAIKLVEKLKTGNIDAVDKWFIKHFDSDKLQEIEKRLSEQYPNRARFFRSGFKNIEQSDYVASINVILPQIDGIFYDKTGHKYFTKGRKDGLKQFDIARTSLINLMIMPLYECTAINTNDVTKFPIRLNRHEILHGLDTDYGTKINALKIISLLNFMDNILTQVIKD